jgi:hypothetical protein
MSSREHQAFVSSKLMFPPVVVLPESKNTGVTTAIFDRPSLVWAPEAYYDREKLQFPCANKGCKCTPRRSKYKSREVHDVHYIMEVFYCEYQCQAKKGNSDKHNGDERRYFNTLSEERMHYRSSTKSGFYNYQKGNDDGDVF